MLNKYNTRSLFISPIEAGDMQKNFDFIILLGGRKKCTHNFFTVVVNVHFFDVTTKSYQLKALTITPLNPEY